MAAKDPRSPSNEPEGAGRGRPAKADWRRPAAHAAPAAPVGKKGGGAWRVKPDRAYEDAKRWYRIRVASWILFVVVLFVVFIVAIIYWPRRTPLVAMAVTEYEYSASLALPPNAWAKEDVESLRDLDTQGEIVAYSNPLYSPTKTGEAAFENLRQEIQRHSGWRNRTIIVYLSIHGAVNQDGKPCLLLPGDSPLASDKWLTLESLLAYLFPGDAQEALPRKKLLILDCNRMDANWQLGLLYNSLADGLKDLVPKVPGLAILNSTGSGQIGWTSPEQLHGSVFAYFVRQGLQGAADARDEGGNDNGDVSLQELAGYVRKRVRQWVLEHRADIQEPKLFTEEKDFFLVHARYEARDIPAAKTDFRTRWTTDIEPLWSRHEQVRAASPWRINPLGWGEFQQGLLRLEQLAVAGPTYDEQYARLKDELNVKVDGLTDQGLPKDLAVSSIPLRLTMASSAESKKVEEERETLRAQWNQAQQRFAAEAVRETSYLAAAAEVWRQCVQGVDSARWPDLLRFVDAQGRRARPAGDVVEMHFLRCLNAYLDPLTLKDRRTPVQRCLAVRDLAEKAAAPADERVHYWVESAVDKADDQRRRAEDLLFVGDPDAAGQAERALDALASSDGRAGAYPDAIRNAERVAKAFALRDRAWAEVPYYARWLLARLRPQNDRHMQLLDSLIQNTHALAAELDRAIAKRDFSGGWEKAFQEAEKNHNSLADDFREECTRLWERAPLNRETLREITVVLSVPLVSGKQRNGLWVNYWEIAAGKRAARDGAEPAPGKPDEKAKTEAKKAGPATEDFRVAGGADQEATATYLKRLPARHPALTILDRSRLGVDEPPCLKAASSPALSSGAADDVSARLARVALQGQCVRELLALGNDAVPRQCAAWLKDSEARLDLGDRSLGENRDGRAKADRLVRAAAPLMDLGRPAWDKPENDPPHQLRRLDLHYLLLWQAYRTLDDFWGPPPDRPQAPSFFATATGEYLSSATVLCPSDKRFRYEGPDLKEPANLRDRLETRTKAAKAALTPKAADLSIKKADPAASKVQEATTPGQLAADVAEHLPEGTAALYLRDPAAGSREEQTIPMLIQGEQGRSEWRRIGLVVKSGQRNLPQRYSVRSDDPRLQHARLKAVGLYRGHEYTSDFTATPPDYELVYTPPKYPPPLVGVFGEAVQEPCPVVFILDCSASMEEDVLDPWERRLGPGQNVAAAAAKLQRFAIAREALEQILERLAKSEIHYDVGMIAYGHRVGWELDPVQRKDIMVTWDPTNPGKTIVKPAANPLVPAEDVEVIRPPSPFGTAELASLTKDLEALRPLGQTPLYSAIQKAVEELDSRRSGGNSGRPTRRHIIVITDGMNEVSGPGKRVIKDDLSQLFQKPENRDVTLDVIGFNLSDWDLLWQYVSRSENKDKLKEALAPLKRDKLDAMAAAMRVDPALGGQLGGFRDLRRELEQLLLETRHSDTAPSPDGARSRGFFHVAGETGVSQVLKALHESLQLRMAKFRIERSGDAATIGTAELGQTVEIQTHVGVKQYAVKVGEGDRMASTEITLEGGEYEMLYLSKDGSRLEHRRYTKNLRVQSENVPDPADPENAAKRFFVGAHIPDWKGSAVQFWLSIQNNNPAKFSPRPEEAWLQIRPLLPDSPEAVPYICYDLTFEPKLPVPELTFVAPDWPRNAEEAEIQLWFKLKKTQPDPQHVISVNDLRKLGGLQLQDVPTAVFTVDTRAGEQNAPYQVVVTERSPQGKPIPGVRVEMDPTPDRIARQYNQKAGTVHNTFYYDAAAAAQAGSFRILFTPHSRLSERAVTLPAPLKVGIARRSR